MEFKLLFSLARTISTIPWSEVLLFITVLHELYRDFGCDKQNNKNLYVVPNETPRMQCKSR